MADAYDCIVIGSGPGGYVAAIRRAARHEDRGGREGRRRLAGAA
jgi:pyruvate/2-oxoglutarate dehydrogenase complex dihydrolipoamide dehydrogenase (E3) component